MVFASRIGHVPESSNRVPEMSPQKSQTLGVGCQSSIRAVIPQRTKNIVTLQRSKTLRSSFSMRFAGSLGLHHRICHARSLHEGFPRHPSKHRPHRMFLTRKNLAARDLPADASHVSMPSSLRHCRRSGQTLVSGGHSPPPRERKN